VRVCSRRLKVSGGLNQTRRASRTQAVCTLTSGYSWSVALGRRAVVDTSAVPQDHVPWTGFDLLPRTPSVQEPLDLALRVVVRVDPFPAALRCFVLVSLEELGVERERPFENHQAAIVGSVLVLTLDVLAGRRAVTHQVHDTLDAVLEAPVGALVDMGPWLSVDFGVFGERKGDVDSV